MTPFLRGWSDALVKLGLSPSATGAIGATAPSVKSMTPTTTNPTAIGSKPKPIQPWSGQNKIEPKMHENAWNAAQKDLDLPETRATAKFDQSNRPVSLPTGSP